MDWTKVVTFAVCFIGACVLACNGYMVQCAFLFLLELIGMLSIMNDMDNGRPA